MNIAYIYEPHFKTSMFRVATKEQQGSEFNYIVVTCSPSYNGVWKYKSSNKSNYDIWMNGKLPCFCVPISDCCKIKELTELTNSAIINRVKKQQSDWLKSNVKNRDYIYKNGKPDWML